MTDDRTVIPAQGETQGCALRAIARLVHGSVRSRQASNNTDYTDRRVSHGLRGDILLRYAPQDRTFARSAIIFFPCKSVAYPSIRAIGGYTYLAALRSHRSVHSGDHPGCALKRWEGIGLHPCVRALEIELYGGFWRRAADERIAFGWWVQRLWGVGKLAFDQATFAVVANA